MARLMHVHTVDTRPFLLRREGPGDKAIGAPDAPVITTLQSFSNLHLLSEVAL